MATAAVIFQRGRGPGKTVGVDLTCVPELANEPAPADADIQSEIRAAARAAGYTALDLPSAAGHDAQEIAHLAPIGMLFVPSRAGIPHSPPEYSSPGDVAKGAEVLYRAVLLLMFGSIAGRELRIPQHNIRRVFANQ